jgi:hypothetical protein
MRTECLSGCHTEGGLQVLHESGEPPAFRNSTRSETRAVDVTRYVLTHRVENSFAEARCPLSTNVGAPNNTLELVMQLWHDQSPNSGTYYRLPTAGT